MTLRLNDACFEILAHRKLLIMLIMYVNLGIHNPKVGGSIPPIATN